MLGCAGAVIVLDQAGKTLVTTMLVPGHLYGWGRGIGLRRTETPRIGALPLSDRQAIVAWIALVACLAFLLAAASPLLTSTTVGFGLSLGGASGNLVDRIVRGAVIDFIAVGRWPAFNLADAAMVAGAVLVALSLLGAGGPTPV